MSDVDDDYIFEKSSSDNLTGELHIYVIPPQLWPERQHFTVLRVTQDYASVGFVRANEGVTLQEVRREIHAQLDTDNYFPTQFYFVRDVDQRLVQVLPNQEKQLRVRDFLPPNSHAAALYLVDKRVADNIEKNFTSVSEMNANAYAAPRGHGLQAPSRKSASQSQSQPAADRDQDRSRESTQQLTNVQLPKIIAKPHKTSLPSYLQVRDIDFQARDYISRQALRTQKQPTEPLQNLAIHSIDDSSVKALQLAQQAIGQRNGSDMSSHIGHSRSMNALNDNHSRASQHTQPTRPSLSPQPQQTEPVRRINQATYRKSAKSQSTPRRNGSGRLDYFYFLTGASESGRDTPASDSNRSTPYRRSPSPRSLERERERLERERVEREREEERRRMDEEMRKQETAMKMKLEQELAEKRAQITRLRDVKNNLQTDLEGLYESKPMRNSEDDRQLAELKRRREETLLRLDREKSMKLGELETVVERMNREVQDLTKAIAKQREANSKEQKELLEQRRKLEQELRAAEERAAKGIVHLETEMKSTIQILEDEKKQKEREFEVDRQKQQEEFEAIKNQLAQIEGQREKLEQDYAIKHKEAQERLQLEYEQRQKDWEEEMERMQKENAELKQKDEELRQKLDEEIANFDEEKAKLEADDAVMQLETQQRLLKLLDENESQRLTAVDELHQRQKSEMSEYADELTRFDEERHDWDRQVRLRKQEEEQRRAEMEKQFKEEDEQRQSEHEAELREIEERMRNVRAQYDESQKRFEDEIKQYKEQDERLQQDTAETIRLARETRRRAENVAIPKFTDALTNMGELAKEKQRLLEERQRARERRNEAERRRDALVKNAKQLQELAQGRRQETKENWKKRYFEAKRKTSLLEDQLERLKVEFDQLHMKLLTQLNEHMQSSAQSHFLKSLILSGDNRPSETNNLRLQASRLKSEIETLQRDVSNAKARLASEAKLRMQADSELRAMRAESMQRRMASSMMLKEAAISDAMQGPDPDNPLFPDLALPLPIIGTAASELNSLQSNVPPMLEMRPPSEADQPTQMMAANDTNNGKQRNQMFEDIRETEREHEENRAVFDSLALNRIEQNLDSQFRALNQIAERA